MAATLEGRPISKMCYKFIPNVLPQPHLAPCETLRTWKFVQTQDSIPLCRASAVPAAPHFSPSAAPAAPQNASEFLLATPAAPHFPYFCPCAAPAAPHFLIFLKIQIISGFPELVEIFQITESGRNKGHRRRRRLYTR
eukprot:gene25754-biopygen16520